MASAILKGDKKLERKLRNLQSAGLRRVMNRAVSRSITPVKNAVKRNAPVSEEMNKGTLKRSIAKKTKSYFKQSGTIVGMVGPKTKFFEAYRTKSGKKRPSLYAHLVLFGTKPHLIESPEGSGMFWRHPGARANNWMEEEFDSQKGKVKSLLRSELKQGLIREAKR